MVSEAVWFWIGTRVGVGVGVCEAYGESGFVFVGIGAEVWVGWKVDPGSFVVPALIEDGKELGKGFQVGEVEDSWLKNPYRARAYTPTAKLKASNNVKPAE